MPRTRTQASHAEKKERHGERRQHPFGDPRRGPAGLFHSRPRGTHGLLLHRLQHLFPDEMEDAIEQRAELPGRDQLERARTRQVDGDHILDPAGTGGHDHHLVAEQDRLLDRVGDEQDRLVRPVEDAHQLFLHDDLGLRVQRGKRLVHEQDRTLHDQRAGQRHPLTHAAGQLLREMALEPAQADRGALINPFLKQWGQIATAMLFSQLLKTVRGGDIPGKGFYVVNHQTVKGCLTDLVVQRHEEKWPSPIDDCPVAITCVSRDWFADGDFLYPNLVIPSGFPLSPCRTAELGSQICQSSTGRLRIGTSCPNQG